MSTSARSLDSVLSAIPAMATTATDTAATDASAEQMEQSDLKYLGVVEVAVDKATMCMAKTYEFVKDSYGPLKPRVDSVESTVRTVVGPLYQKIEVIPYEILRIVDRKVDDAMGVIDDAMGVIDDVVARQVPEAVKSVVSDLQSYYATYEPVAEEWTSAVRKQFSKLLCAPQAVHFTAPPTLSCAEKFNQVVDDAMGVIDGVVPQSVKEKSSQAYGVARQAPEAVVSDLQSNGLVGTAKSYYATYEPDTYN